MAALLRQMKDGLVHLFFRVRYRTRMVRIAFHLKPMAGAEEPDDSGGDDGGDDSGAGDGGGEDSAAEDTGDSAPSGLTPPGEDASAEEWRAYARQWEKRAKAPPPGHEESAYARKARRAESRAAKLEKERKDLQERLKAREDADKSEQEKAIEQAEQKARQDAEAGFQKERRKDRLEVATTKLAAKGLRIGDGDDAKTVRFADPDDALLHLERDIRNGDLDEDDIFDENGKVQSDKLEDALSDLLSRKPHLAADTKPPRVKGSADAGKGAPADTDGSVDKELGRIRRHSGDSKDARYRRAA